MWSACISLLVLSLVSILHAGSPFQERHKMIIHPKTESCFFLADMQEGYIINLRYLVMSSKNGKQQDITMRLRDNTKRMITYQVSINLYFISVKPVIRAVKPMVPIITQ